MVGYRVQIPDRTHPKKPNGRYPSITKRFKLGEKELAQQWLTREVAYLEDCVLKGVPYVSGAERKKKRQALSVTFSEFGTQWVYNYRDAKGDPIRPDSMRAKRVRVRHLVDFFTTVKDDELLADITAQDCRECRDWLEQFGPVVRTNTMTVLNTILKKAARPIEGKRPALRVGTAPPTGTGQALAQVPHLSPPRVTSSTPHRPTARHHGRRAVTAMIPTLLEAVGKRRRHRRNVIRPAEKPCHGGIQFSATTHP